MPIEVNSLMDYGNGGGFWSRDHSLPDVSCGIKECSANNKMGRCIMPSLIKIGEDGRCETGKECLKKKIIKKKKINKFDILDLEDGE